ncbi:protein C19orf12 homolog [Contarinia nasturtii]|uniref:protein C19orf12 homolog n=1 Tax=Contarinia nasturtii TaxID=265458 RepID=UPI0012D3B34D|nr:protein C19orf12 homolog [Contarinia nasturtii]
MGGMYNLSKSIRRGLLSGLICGGAAFVGGLIGGPIGIGLGSAIGGAIGARIMSFRSAPTVLREDFKENERRELLERGKRLAFDAKEALLKVLLELITALTKCRSWREAAEAVLHPLLKELTEVTIKSFLRYLSG